MILVKWSRSNPTQPVIGPGNTGRNDPMMPSITNKNPMMSKKISMLINC
ncbi:hypothetical protein [Urechidicola vernalis]|uniref:Uncharacterized protein n=1 Tax=Urechidicola vernalis TaxID=3075600 RepID=A0ABU2Y3R6_9FLAO|nr:hypothetical protein [Urechidicola sp. P050]MDT0552811.1 hypothetical protein [Urechidicola sp. P050]